MPRIKLSGFGRGLYRIGGLLFEDGVAEVDEITHSDREIIAMLGAEVEGEDQAAPEESGEPVSAPEAAQSADDPDAGDPEPETGAQPVTAEEPPAEAEPTSPEVNGSSFVDPTPATDAQAAAAPFETTTVASDTDGSEILDAGSAQQWQNGTEA